MAIFGSKIEDFVVDEINKRQAQVANPAEMGFVHAARQPYVILESNAVTAGGDNTLAMNNVLYGGSEEFIKQNMGSTVLSRVSLDTYKEFDIGYRPPPGITSLAVNNETPLGSIRKATVNFQCWTLEDLEKLQVLYMNPGIYLYLQWGFTGPTSPIVTDTLFAKDGKTATKDKVVQLLRSGTIKNNIIKNNGNYDALIGISATFNWKINSMGGFDCTTTIISPASLVYSFLTDSPDIRSNNFYQWMTGVTDSTAAAVADAKPQPIKNNSVPILGAGVIDTAANIAVQASVAFGIRTEEQQVSQTDQAGAVNPSATLKVNAVKLSGGTEQYFQNEGTKYYTYITLPSSVTSGGMIKPEDATYISFGHLCVIINNVFLYGTPETFKEDLSKNRFREEFYSANKLVSFIDLANDRAYCKNYKLLRSFNPSEILIFNSSAEFYVPDDKRLMNKMAGTYDTTLLEFKVAETPTTPYKIPEQGSDFSFGHTKRIFINVNTVVSIMKEHKQFNEFLDAILNKINSSVGGLFSLIKDVDDEALSIKITDETLSSSNEIITVFNTYAEDTVIRNIQLDGNLPSSFQTAAYVGNTNVNPAQRDTKLQAAFSAASNGYFDGNANIEGAKDPISGYEPTYGLVWADTDANGNKVLARPESAKEGLTGTPAFKADKEKGWDVVIIKPLDDTSVANYQNQFNSVLKVYTRGSNVSNIGFPVGITFSMELDGLGGFYYGNLFNVDYIPEFLRTNICFRIININHDVKVGDWITKVSGILTPISNIPVTQAKSLAKGGKASASSSPVSKGSESPNRLYVKDGHGQSSDVTDKIKNIYALDVNAKRNP